MQRNCGWPRARKLAAILAPVIRRRLLLAANIIGNFGLLFAFKYADFFSGALNALFDPGIPQLRWLLPVGISFHTFQAVGYTVDVYRAKVKAERNLLTYALYVAFFPQMVERPGHLLLQLREQKQFDYDRLRSGLRTALWGLIKKPVVADLVAPVVNTVYSQDLFRVGLPRFEMAFLPVALVMVACGEHFRQNWPSRLKAAWNRRPLRWFVYASGIYGMVFFGIFQHIEFIYFQF